MQPLPYDPVDINLAIQKRILIQSSATVVYMQCDIILNYNRDHHYEALIDPYEMRILKMQICALLWVAL